MGSKYRNDVYFGVKVYAYIYIHIYIYRFICISNVYMNRTYFAYLEPQGKSLLSKILLSI